MLVRLRMWLVQPLAEALEGLESDVCALKTQRQDLLDAWKAAETELDSTYRRVHSELGYIDKRSADLRRAEEKADPDSELAPVHGPFAGGRANHASRNRR